MAPQAEESRGGTPWVGVIHKRASISPLVRPTRSGENKIENAYAFSSISPEREIQFKLSGKE